MKKTLGIQAYLIISNILLVVVAVGTVWGIWSSEHTSAVERAMRDQVLKRAELLSQLISKGLPPGNNWDVDQINKPTTNIDDNMTAVFIANDKAILNLTPKTLSEPISKYIILYSQSALQGQARTTEIVTDRKISIYSAVPVRDSNGNVVGAVCLIVPLDSLEQDFLNIRTSFYKAISLIALLGLAFSFILTFLISRRISDAKKMAEMVSEGDYHLRLPQKGPSEFRELAGYLNQMAEELEEQTRQRQTLLTNVTHELARPLGGLRLGVDSLQNGAIHDTAIANDLLNSMADTIQRMEALLDDITLAAYPKTKPIKLAFSRVDPVSFLNKLVPRFQTRALRENITIDLDIPKKLPFIRADERRLNQIMGNLMDNALKFTPHGKQIHISVKMQDKENIQFSVRDEGNGIPEEDIPYIFSPFYQGQPGKRIRQGMGLGLSIAKQLVEIHGGTLDLKNHPDGGAIATITLPTGVKKTATAQSST